MSFAIISLSPERGANGKISLIGKFRYSSAGPARKLFAIWPPTRKDFDGANPNAVARSNPVAPVACDRLAACRRLGMASVPRCIWTSRYPQVLALLDGPVAAWFNCRGLQATKQNKPAPAQTEISVNCDRHHGTIRLGSQYRAMGGDSLTPKHSCPSCGRPMGLRGQSRLAQVTVNCVLMAAENAGYGSRKEGPQEIGSKTGSFCPSEASANWGLVSSVSSNFLWLFVLS